MHNPLDMLVFAKVVELKSFSLTARRLGISRSAASKHVSRLEESLGARLLNRTTRKLSLTEPGHAAYAHCASPPSGSEWILFKPHFSTKTG